LFALICAFFPSRLQPSGGQAALRIEEPLYSPGGVREDKEGRGNEFPLTPFFFLICWLWEAQRQDARASSQNFHNQISIRTAAFMAAVHCPAIAATENSQKKEGGSGEFIPPTLDRKLELQRP
jgi:hypothetical protein